jgi:acetyl esterase/lipase
MTMRPDIARAFQHLVSIFDMSALASQEQILAAARDAIERYGDIVPREPEADVRIQPVAIGGMAAEWLLPPGCATEQRLLFLHGGGLICGSRNSHRPTAAELARRTGFAVLNIDYRLAPEHVFPAAHDDAAAAFTHLCATAPDGSPAPARRAFIAGNSAGANLALDVCAQGLARGDRLPDALALLTPCLDNTQNPRRPERATDPIINDRTVAPMALYAAGTPLDDPRISALFLPDAVLERFPPILIQASAAEFLLPDAQTLAGRLTGLGRRNVLSVWPDMPHDWHSFLRFLPEARAALTEAAQFLIRCAGA